MNSTGEIKIESKKVWTALVTNLSYLTGLLTLDYSLKKSGSKYPLVALFTDGLPSEGLNILKARRIPTRHISFLQPTVHKDYGNDVRFYNCWSKLASFSLVEYDRVVQLDSDMLVLQNMDELMDLELDDAALGGRGQRVFAACHACTCNPLDIPHYPSDWFPKNCAYSSQHSNPDQAQVQGPPTGRRETMLNGGLLVLNPSEEIYNTILCQLEDPTATMRYAFADQSLLSDIYQKRWVPLPYIYNALKPMRWPGVHSQIWRDYKVKNLHYILSSKPWDDEDLEGWGSKQKRYSVTDETHDWWWKINNERMAEEKANGIIRDGF
ncbi:TPA_exp: Uncharacterized protein A8136_2424 [Trichophyton benhamiae CBS 112371]|nr:TPA_exp: Uncharacterized protein A8136_2424 [Trichophyton benhamiae CBS 112371]